MFTLPGLVVLTFTAVAAAITCALTLATAPDSYSYG
jgi:hypothetical protein